MVAVNYFNDLPRYAVAQQKKNSNKRKDVSGNGWFLASCVTLLWLAARYCLTSYSKELGKTTDSVFMIAAFRAARNERETASYSRTLNVTNA
jgi:hypothetical protein